MKKIKCERKREKDKEKGVAKGMAGDMPPLLSIGQLSTGGSYVYFDAFTIIIKSKLLGGKK